MKFTIDEAYLTGVNGIREYSVYQNIPADKLTPEQLVRIIKGEDRVKEVSAMDHPEFTKLRDFLEENSYIRTEKRWWNGDIVLKTFELNGHVFERDEKFLCASALKVSFNYKKNLYKSMTV